MRVGGRAHTGKEKIPKVDRHGRAVVVERQIVLKGFYATQHEKQPLVDICISYIDLSFYQH